MKRVLKILSLLVFVVPMIAATTMYLATEKKYAFTAENLAATIPEFVEDENKQIEMAKKWVELADPDTGMLSIADMFSACRAGGFNTYREVGFTQCRALIVKLLENAEGELDEDFLNGYCPGLDEKGKNPNALSTITDKTRIGGLCSSKNIYAGEVTFRKGYNCTCMAYACNNGYELKKGQCVTLVADGQGNCLRKEFPKTNKVNTMAKAVEFCQDYATKNKCKYTNAIIYHSKSQIVCNAEIGEVDNVKAGMLENQDRKIAALQYYEVCGQHRGKTGKTEHCVDSLFKGVDVGLNEAAGLAQLYAKKNHGKTIYCDTKYRSVSNDDYIKCATLDKDVYYEFKFDDVIETNDATKFKNTVRGISLIYGGNWNGYNISGNCTQSLKNAAKKFGMKTNERYGVCVFEYGKKIESKDMGSKLRTIDGIDNYVFYHEIQLRGSTKLRDNLKAYVKNQGFVVTAFDCDNSYGRIKTGALQGDDEILTCRLSGSKDGQRYTNQPIDFAFDDLSESKKVTREAGDAGVQCIIGRGVYANSKCHGLSQSQCTQVNAKLKAENPKSSGAVWQNGQCVLIDVQEQNEFQNGLQIGLTVISLVDCATTVVGNAQGAMGCTLAVVEITGMVTEMTTGEAMQQRADNFLKIATACHQRSCAVSTIKNMAARVISVQDGLKSASTANAIDTELARLIGYLEPEDLEKECTGACDYKQVIAQLGGDPDDASGRALVVANKIGFIAQFTSLGASAFRLTGKALAKLGVKASAKATKTGAKVAAVTAAKGADMVSDASRAGSKVASHADDITSVAKKSLKEELASINVKQIDNYQDIATGRTIKADEVLRRIEAMPGGTGAAKTRAEELAEIGVREFNTYQDMGKPSLFISKDEVLHRIDDMPSSVPTPTSVVDDAGDATKGASKTTSGATGGATGGASNGTPPGSGSTGSHGGNGGSGGTSGSSGSTGGSGNTGPHNNTGAQGASAIQELLDRIGR